MADKIFADGFFVKKPHENAPEFVIGKLSIKVSDAMGFLGAQPEEWVNLDIKESKGGKYYISVDTWKPDNKEHEPPEAPENATNDDLPF